MTGPINSVHVKYCLGNVAMAIANGQHGWLLLLLQQQPKLLLSVWWGWRAADPASTGRVGSQKEESRTQPCRLPNLSYTNAGEGVIPERRLFRRRARDMVQGSVSWLNGFPGCGCPMTLPSWQQSVSLYPFTFNIYTCADYIYATICVSLHKCNVHTYQNQNEDGTLFQKINIIKVSRYQQNTLM